MGNNLPERDKVAVLLALLIISFLVNSILFVPFINLLYSLRLQRAQQEFSKIFRKKIPIFSKFHAKKAGTPVGGGILLVSTTTILFFLSLLVLYYFWYPITAVFNLSGEIKILFFTFIFFALIGIYDDLRKIFPIEKNGEFGLRVRHKLILETILALIVGSMLYYYLKIDIINVPVIGVLSLGIWYVPIAAFIIVAFTNAYNITDGLDGLAGGLLLIALSFFWVISASILDTPLSIFIAILIGGLISFLYFNVFPARLFLGDVGALSFGATLAVIGLMLGKNFSLPMIGGVFVLEVSTSLVQMLSKKILKKKIFSAAPLHLLLQHLGWEEPKIVMRAWLAGLILGLIGLLLVSI